MTVIGGFWQKVLCLMIAYENFIANILFFCLIFYTEMFCEKFLHFSLWWGARSVQSLVDNRLLHHDCCHPPLLPPLHHQGGPGVWESCHLQTWKIVVWGSKRSWSLLYNSLCGCLWKDWSENCHLWDPTTRGLFVTTLSWILNEIWF